MSRKLGDGSNTTGVCTEACALANSSSICGPRSQTTGHFWALTRRGYQRFTAHEASMERTAVVAFGYVVSYLPTATERVYIVCWRAMKRRIIQ